jgi:hypothetical protein
MMHYSVSEVLVTQRREQLLGRANRARLTRWRRRVRRSA